jgi:hypothetical protein
MASAIDGIEQEGTPAAIGRRGAPRARVQTRATLETTTGVVSAILRNISCSGAMLEGSRLPKANRTAILRSGDVEVMGYVVWEEEDRCGFLFFDPLSHDTVVREARRQAAIASETMPKFEVAGISDTITVDDWLKTKARVNEVKGSFLASPGLTGQRGRA